MSDREYFAAEAGLVEFLGGVQKWFCPICETRIELGSEALTFVSSPKMPPAWPLVVHSECREGLNTRRGFSGAWAGLETAAIEKRARERLETVRGRWVKALRAKLPKPEPDPKPAAAAAPKTAPAGS